MSFHLAYLKLNTDFFMSGRPTAEKLQYALVPVELPSGEKWYFDHVDLNGRPLGRFAAMPEFLCTLRQPGIEAGKEDSLEVRLVETLKGRARNASQVVPEIVATQRTPRWSKLVLPAHVITELRRLGGAA